MKKEISKEIIYNDNAQKKLLDGINGLADAVKVTLGPRGRNVVFVQPHSTVPIVTKDGVSVAKEISFADPFMNMGANMIKEASSKSNDHAGDGTTTTTVLTQALAKGGYSAIMTGASPIELKRGIDFAAEKAVEYIKEMSVPCLSYEEIQSVATISANGEKSIGKLIADAMASVGKDGIVTIEPGGVDDSIQITEGMQFSRGYESPYFATDRDRGICEFQKPVFMLFKGKLVNVREIQHILGLVIRENKTKGRPLVIMAEDFSADFLNTIVANMMNNVFQAVLIKTPGVGHQRNDFLEDIAVVTGSDILNAEDGVKHDKLTPDDYHLSVGTCERITVLPGRTTIVGGAHKDDVLNNHLESIRTKISTLSESGADMDIEFQQKRISRLAGGVAVIKVGAPTELELREKKDRVDDALCATYAATEEGILPGGGIALVNIAKKLNDMPISDYLTGDRLLGAELFIKALYAPFNTILENAGVHPQVALQEINNLIETLDGEEDIQLIEQVGFDASTGEVDYMMDAGVIDPAKVTRNAVQISASVAGSVITTGAAIAPVETHKDDFDYMM